MSAPEIILDLIVWTVGVGLPCWGVLIGRALGTRFFEWPSIRKVIFISMPISVLIASFFAYYGYRWEVRPGETTAEAIQDARRTFFFVLVPLWTGCIWSAIKLKFDVGVPEPLSHSLKAIAWMIAGITVAVLLVAQGFHVFQVMRGGATASARVIETHDDVLENSNGRRAVVVTIADYEFSAQGTRFGGWTEGAQGEFSVGDAIDIEYNPKNPSQNRRKGDRGALGNYLWLLLFGGLFSYYTIKLHFPVLRRLFVPAAPSTHETAPQ
jgi:hypothetical protein